MGNADSSNILKENEAPVVVYSKTTCPYCVKAKNLLEMEKIDYLAHELNKMANGTELATELRSRTGLNYVPQIFVCGKLIGGYSELEKLHQEGVLRGMAEKCSRQRGVRVQ